MWVGSLQEKVDLLTVQLGGSGGMPPLEILKNRDQKTEFGDISATKAPQMLAKNMYTLYTL